MSPCSSPVSVVAGLLALTAFTFHANAQTFPVVLAQWTFETSQPATAGPFAAEIGSYASSSFASSNTGGTFTSPNGVNGSANSFSSTSWGSGEYFQFTTSSAGYSDLTLKFEQFSSSTGPKTFNVLYSTNGTNFTQFSSYTVGASFSAKTIDLSSISAIDQAATVYFRLAVDPLSKSVSDGIIQGSGTSRIDNVIIRAASASSVIPEPSFALLGAVGAIGLLRRRRL